MNTFFWPHLNEADGSHYMALHKAVFPTQLWIPSLFFPLYAPGELAVSFGQFSFRGIDGQIGQIGIFGDWGYSIESLKWQTSLNVPIEYASSFWKWDLVLITPVIWITIFSLIGMLIPKVKRQ